MIKIITDSTCDIDSKQAISLGIEIVPLTVRFKNEEYLDGVTISNDQFFSKLKTCDELPVTSQPSPAVFEEIFLEHVKNNDQILGIFVSSKLSGTFQSALIAANNIRNEYEDAKIELIDSRNVSIGVGLLVLEAVKLNDNNNSLSFIAKKCNELIKYIHVYAMAGSLTYLQKGGRLSASAALIGSLLKIIPVIEVVDGSVQIAYKARGIKAAVKYLGELLENASLVDNSTLIYAQADAKSLLHSFVEKDITVPETVTKLTGVIGCIVGTHIGPGSLGIAYIDKNMTESVNKKAV